MPDALVSILACAAFPIVAAIMPSLAVAAAKGPADYELLQQRMGDVQFDERPWAEVETTLPAAPLAENLVPIYVGPISDNKFSVDLPSVVLGEDGVVRYTLVVVSPSGARNVSFEGIRCSTAERRLYAFGRRDGSWSKARNNAWVKIEDNTLNRHHAALWGDYFCAAGGLVLSTEDARRSLRNGGSAVLRPGR